MRTREGVLRRISLIRIKRTSVPSSPFFRGTTSNIRHLSAHDSASQLLCEQHVWRHELAAWSLLWTLNLDVSPESHPQRRSEAWFGLGCMCHLLPEVDLKRCRVRRHPGLDNIYTFFVRYDHLALHRGGEFLCAIGFHPAVRPRLSNRCVFFIADAFLERLRAEPSRSSTPSQSAFPESLC